MKKIYLLLLPFFFTELIYAQNQTHLDIKNISAFLKIKPIKKQVAGEVELQFMLNQACDSIFLDAKNMEEVVLKTSKVSVKTTSEKIWFYNDFKSDSLYSIQFEYLARPQQTLYFNNWDTPEKAQVFSQGQGKYTSHWLPSLDDMNDKIEFDLSFEAPRNYTLISNGKLISKNDLEEVSRWTYDMQKPMSSYLVMLALGKFDYKKIQSKSGVPIYLYYAPRHQNLVEPTYRYTQEIFDFLESNIGVAYPWQNYKQVPVKDFLYAGMENTGATVFSEQFLTDSIGFVDQNYLNVNAHELAHQWFGNLITETSSTHHWLHEGFATYYALKAEREIFGDDYFFYSMYQTAERLSEASQSGRGEALLNTKASSLTYYQKGAWALFFLENKLGESVFKKIVKSFLEKYAYQNVRTEDFIMLAEEISGKDLGWFEEKWLLANTFPSYEAMRLLSTNEFMQKYLALNALRELPLEQKIKDLKNALSVPVNDYLGQEAVIQLSLENTHSPEVVALLKMALKSESLLVKQSVALHIDKIPPTLKEEYEQLLYEKSYTTQEAALLNLWINFQENRVSYLDQLKDKHGFYNKSLRHLWLGLHLATPSYDPHNKSIIFQELNQYTNALHDISIRRSAFSIIRQINLWSDESLLNLIKATQHYNWRFYSFARNLIKELAKQRELKEQIIALSQQVEFRNKQFLKTILD